MKYITLIITSLTIFFGGVVLVASAQGYDPLVTLPGVTTVGTAVGMGEYLAGMMKFIVAIAGVFAIVVAIIGGTQYVAAGISPNAKGDAKDRIMNAFIGLALVLTSYLILNSINPKLVQFNLSLDPITSTPSAGTTAVSSSGGTSVLATGGTGVSAPLLGSGASPISTTPIVPTPVVTYTINGTVGTNGAISPTGDTTTAIGGTRTYVITPVYGYKVATLSVNGTAVATSTSYTFNNVTANSSIAATFVENVDITNDYAIMVWCTTSISPALCAKTDLNADGKTDASDFMFFAQKGGRFDLNSDKKIGLVSETTPTSCFFKTNTVDISGLLPKAQSYSSGDWDSWYTYYGEPSGCAGDGGLLPPTMGCNGRTWLKASTIGRTCAADMSFGYDYTGGGQYTKFQNWVMGATSGTLVNLSTLFVRAFYDTNLASGWVSDGNTGFSNTDLARVSYTTIAQYDLDDNGFADFSAGGKDIEKFALCVGKTASVDCVQADFSQADFSGDGVVDKYDLVFRDFMVNVLFKTPDKVVLVATVDKDGKSLVDIDGKPVVDKDGNPLVATSEESFPSIINNPLFIPYLWYLNWFESAFFASIKHTDRQITQYCIGHKPFEKCGAADMNDSCLTQYRSCGVDMTCRAAAASCKVDSTDVTAFDAIGATLDFNSDGNVNLR